MLIESVLKKLREAGHPSYNYMCDLKKPFSIKDHMDLTKEQKENLKRYEKLKKTKFFIQVT